VTKRPRLGVPIAVAGSAEANPATLAAAEELGALLADAGFVVLTGGLGGVMEAASRGARSRLGVTVGILPGDEPAEANGWVELALPTGLGETRNAVLARAARGLVAIGRGYGTLSEIAFALKLGRPVVGLGSWDVEGLEPADSARAAAERITALVTQNDD
jgi:uncharacterized protein (TIGR00725 family)